MTRPVKRSFSIRGHRTSISLEQEFWEALREAARSQARPLADIVAEIDAGRGATGLSSAVRIWVLDHFRKAALGVQGPARERAALIAE